MYVLAWQDDTTPPPDNYVVVQIAQGLGNSNNAQRTVEASDSPVVAGLTAVTNAINNGTPAISTFTGARKTIGVASRLDVFDAVAGNLARRLQFRNLGPSDALYAYGADADDNPGVDSETMTLYVGEKITTDFRTAARLNVYSAGGTVIEAVALS